jgi:deoxyadenosine/deoxycytidine kinase
MLLSKGISEPARPLWRKFLRILMQNSFERFADNLLPKFYKDQNRYAFPLEMSFFGDRYQQLSDDLAQFDLFKDF